jgi:cytochrome c556
LAGRALHADWRGPEAVPYFLKILMKTLFQTRLSKFALVALLAASAVQAQVPAPGYAVSQRQNVNVSAAEHAHLLTEMNAFLTAVHGINTALAAKDFATVASLATQMGPKGGHEDPVGKALHDTLPKDWFAIAKPTHQAFLGIANEAKTNPSVEAVLAKVNATTAQCVACHSTYRLTIKP